MLHNIIFAMGIGRILLGLAPFVAAETVSRVLRFPASHDNPTTRLMARYFGVRDVGLGVLAFYGLQHLEALRFILIFNALTDLGDLSATLIPIVRRQGIDRAAYASASMALFASIAWFTVWLAAG